MKEWEYALFVQEQRTEAKLFLYTIMMKWRRQYWSVVDDPMNAADVTRLMNSRGISPITRNY